MFIHLFYLDITKVLELATLLHLNVMNDTVHSTFEFDPNANLANAFVCGIPKCVDIFHELCTLN
ncbi:hypothetical protein Avbf_00124 [Armadillidium vulgare]|nr:hypothetical protein Avbf_00124 [Armadillidium vulgare]